MTNDGAVHCPHAQGPVKMRIQVYQQPVNAASQSECGSAGCIWILHGATRFQQSRKCGRLVVIPPAFERRERRWPQRDLRLVHLAPSKKEGNHGG